MLGDVAEIRSGYGFPPALQGKPEGEIPFFKVGDISRNHVAGNAFLGRAEHYISWAEAHSLRAVPFPQGTTAFAKIGAAIALNRRAIASESCLFDNNVMGLSPRPAVNERFLYSFMLTVRLEQISQATTVPSLRKSDLAEIEIGVPPLNEQRRIVEKIDALFAHSKKARESLDRIPALLDKLKKSILAAAFRGDLTRDWREQHPTGSLNNPEPASVLLERIRAERRRRWEEAELAKMRAKGKEPKDDKWKAKYEEPAPVDAEGLPELPRGWVWASLDTLSEIKTGLAKGQRHDDGAELVRVPYLRVANVQRGHLVLDEVFEIDAPRSRFEELRLQPGDVLLNEGGDRDKLGRGWVWNGEIKDCIHQNHVFRARPMSGLEPELISHYANTYGQAFFIDQGKQTTNLASVSKSKVAALPVPVPPGAEQLALVAVLRDSLSRAEAVAAALRAARRRNASLDQAILAKAFRGELVPQDPNDEPASVLLERIRAEREAAGDTPKRGGARRSPKQLKGNGTPVEAASFDVADEADALGRLEGALQQLGELTNATAQEATGLGPTEVRGLLKKLVELGLAKKTGAGRGTRYVAR